MARRVVPLAGLAALLTVALAGSSGCGKSKERELFEQRRAACQGLVGKTVVEARQLLTQLEVVFQPCDTSLTRVAGDICGGAAEGPYSQPVCQLGFAWRTNDQGLCSPRSCEYACLPRVDEAQITALGIEAPICAVEFFAPQ